MATKVVSYSEAFRSGAEGSSEVSNGLAETSKHSPAETSEQPFGTAPRAGRAPPQLLPKFYFHRIHANELTQTPLQALNKAYRKEVPVLGTATI